MTDHAEKVARRPSFTEIYLRFAVELSRRSTCRRLSVGCVITTEDYRQVLAVGYNGNAAGLPNDCDSATPGACGCIHSEENAVISCGAPRSVPKFVFCTDMPCGACAKRLIQLGGVKKVRYLRDYRLRTGLDVLGEGRIDAARWVNLDGDFQTLFGAP